MAEHHGDFILSTMRQIGIASGSIPNFHHIYGTDVCDEMDEDECNWTEYNENIPKEGNEVPAFYVFFVAHKGPSLNVLWAWLGDEDHKPDRTNTNGFDKP